MRLSEQQRKDLALVNTELSGLANKTGKWTPQDDVRFGQLKANLRAIEGGMTLAELDEDRLNEDRRRNGLETKQNSEHPRAAELRGWKAFVEKRGMTEGAPMLNHIGTYSGLGFFVPNEWFPKVFAAMKAHDVLFDGDSGVTFINSTNGRPMTIPTMDGTPTAAQVGTEAGSQTSVDIDSTSHGKLGGYTFSTDRYVASLESFDDLESGITCLDLFTKFSADALARGIGQALVNGDGNNTILGLVPSLEALGGPSVVAAGSNNNDGLSIGGANSIGSDDLKAAINAIDSAYINERTAWLMNQKTLAALSGQLTKYGQILDLVKYVGGKPFIFGIPVKICPSLDDIGASKVPIVLGDLSYWATRLIVAPDFAGIKVYREAPGLIENGNVGFRTFVRAHGTLLSSSTTQTPFVFIRNHS